VYVVDELSTIQHRVFDRPTVVVAKHVSGAEEIPLGATAVLSGSSVDVLSHSAVRARNSKVFFATCYDADTVQSLLTLDGQVGLHPPLPTAVKPLVCHLAASGEV
jgi:alpha-glucan,water dikinase